MNSVFSDILAREAPGRKLSLQDDVISVHFDTVKVSFFVDPFLPWLMLKTPPPWLQVFPKKLKNRNQMMLKMTSKNCGMLDISVEVVSVVRPHKSA